MSICRAFFSFDFSVTLIEGNNNTFAEHKGVIEGLLSKAEATANKMNHDLELAQQRMNSMMSDMMTHKQESDILRREIDKFADVQRAEVQQLKSNSEASVTSLC